MCARPPPTDETVGAHACASATGAGGGAPNRHGGPPNRDSGHTLAGTAVNENQAQSHSLFAIRYSLFSKESP
jgi:hypothetical protein